MRILLIEDHLRLARSIVEGLAGFGLSVDAFPTGGEALAATKAISYDAIILDLGLPDGDGLDLIDELHKTTNRIPILILTARDDVDDRVAGLDRGADDYQLKPFAMKELAARLRALLRRPGAPLGIKLSIGNICLDTNARHLTVAGRVVAISPREIAALELLMRRTDKIVSKRLFEDTIYGFNEEVTANTIEALISRLRRRLQVLHADVTIHTLRGIGYLLTE